ncbi:MAG TPA: hypothetical protein VJO16_16125 [Candidatus Acidoferrum sp.]|nr:hypothetical protein [Candidatus Acidoferrum sp.]
MAFAVIALLLPQLSSAQNTVLNFENLPQAPLITQYANKGVTFNGHMLRDYSQTPGFTHSGHEAVELCFAAEFCSSPLQADFTVGQSRVKVWVGFSSPMSAAATVALQAFNQNGTLIRQVTAVLGPSNTPILVRTPLQINTTDANIRRILVTFLPTTNVPAFNNGLVVDDFEFRTAGGPPVCTTTVSPAVQLQQPLANTVFQTNNFPLQGQVATAAPLQSATLTVTNSAGTKSSSLLGILIQQSGGPFGVTSVFDELAPGSNSVKVTAANCHGSGQSPITVSYQPIVQGTGFKLIGMEVVQATQDLQNTVPLVAGKPAMVRLYLAVTGPTSSIDSVSAAITATHPGSNTSLPNLRSVNSVTVTSSLDPHTSRHDLAKTINFMLPADWYAEGTLHISVSEIDVHGTTSPVPCDGCENNDNVGPLFTHFQPTKALNLVLAPYVYEPHSQPGLVATPDIFFTPMGALQWLNDVYPLSGNFPAIESAVNIVRILPMQTTTKNLHDGGEQDDFLNDLDDLLDNLRSDAGNSWPSDVHLLAMTPCGCGGIGNAPGGAGMADTWAVEHGVVPQKNFESYGAVWSHELGHNFGRQHAGDAHDEEAPQDLSFPYPHGGIGEPGLALTTEWWNASPFLIDPGIPATGQQHAHDFMSYGDANDLADHTHDWISPYTYKALFQQFLDLNARSAPRQNLIVHGSIAKSGDVVFRPFHIATTAFAGESAESAEYRIELQDAAGRELVSQPVSISRRDRSSSKYFSAYIPWHPETKRIVMKDKNKILADREVSSHKPNLHILSPKGGETWGATATITWKATDEDGDNLTFTVLYNARQNDQWIPLAAGLKEQSVTINTSLVPGSKKARIRVQVTDGVNTAEADSGAFVVPEKPPLVAILGLKNGMTLSAEKSNLVGAAYDPQDGMLPSGKLKWTSSRGGLLGEGARITPRRLAAGRHTITLTATNSRGHRATAKVNVIVRGTRVNGHEPMPPTALRFPANTPS